MSLGFNFTPLPLHFHNLQMVDLLISGVQKCEEQAIYHFRDIGGNLITQRTRLLKVPLHHCIDMKSDTIDPKPNDSFHLHLDQAF